MQSLTRILVANPPGETEEQVCPPCLPFFLADLSPEQAVDLFIAVAEFVV